MNFCVHCGTGWGNNWQTPSSWMNSDSPYPSCVGWNGIPFRHVGTLLRADVFLVQPLGNIGETYSTRLLYPNALLVPNVLSSLPIWITQHSNCLVYWTFLVRENEIVEWILPGCHCGHHVVKGATAPFSGWFQSCFSQMVRKQQKDASFPAIYLLFFLWGQCCH